MRPAGRVKRCRMKPGILTQEPTLDRHLPSVADGSRAVSQTPKLELLVRALHLQAGDLGQMSQKQGFSAAAEMLRAGVAERQNTDDVSVPG